MYRFMSLIPLALIACNGDDGGDGPFAVTVSVPDSYFDTGVHPGIDYEIAIVDGDGAVLDSATGTLPTATGAAHEVDLSVDGGDSYEVHFWVDSDIGGGTAGTCDGGTDFFDHQWVYALGTVDADRDFALPAHNTDFTDVCATFD